MVIRVKPQRVESCSLISHDKMARSVHAQITDVRAINNKVFFTMAICTWEQLFKRVKSL